MTFLPVLYSSSLLLIIPLIGFCLRRYTSLRREFFEDLNKLLISVSLPLLLFTNIVQTDLTKLRSGFIFTALGPGLVLILLGCSYILFRVFKIHGNLRRVGLAMSSMGNSGYMPLIVLELLPLGIPWFESVFSRETAVLFISAYLLGQNPTLWSLGNYLITGRGEKPKLSTLINPPMIGVLVGFCSLLLGIERILFDRSLPYFYVFNSLTVLGRITLPLVLISLGAMIADLKVDRKKKGQLITFVGLVTSIRFILVPALFYLLYFYALVPAGAAPIFVLVLFLQMHTPPALNLTVMAARSGENKDYTALATLVTYLLFIPLLPLYLFLFLRLSRGF